MKSNGTIYWYGTSPSAIIESDLSANLRYEYFFFNGQRVGRSDHSNSVTWYFADHLGSSRVVWSTAANDNSDFYPFGGERIITSGAGNQYKFTGKERDAESGLDNFGAHYDSSNMGRFITPDWSRDPEGVPYADIQDPQSLNLYAYVGNNPMARTDDSGHSHEVCDDTSFVDANGALHVVAGSCHLVSDWRDLNVGLLGPSHHFVDQALIRARGWNSLAGQFFRRWVTGPLANPGPHKGFSAMHRLNSAQIKDIIAQVEAETGRSFSQWNEEDIEKGKAAVQSAGGSVKDFTDVLKQLNPSSRGLGDDTSELMNDAKAAFQAIEGAAAKIAPEAEELMQDIEEECAGGGCVPPL